MLGEMLSEFAARKKPAGQTAAVRGGALERDETVEVHVKPSAVLSSLAEAAELKRLHMSQLVKRGICINYDLKGKCARVCCQYRHEKLVLPYHEMEVDVAEEQNRRKAVAWMERSVAGWNIKT